MIPVKPLKKFGQNYLTDPNIIVKIVEEINPLPEDNIIEIGPGLGVLTKELYKKNPGLTAVEIDTRVIEQLKESFPEINLINQDFLKSDLSLLCKNKEQRLRIAGNIPYNLTSPIVFKLLENHNLVQDAVLMVQHEVAKRMTAPKGIKDYGILAVILGYFTDISYCFKVSPNVFYPRPKVFSAVVHIRFKKDLPDETFNKYFIATVKAAFGNRRKTLKNSLNNSIFGKFNFDGCGIDLSLRAEQLDINDFIKLAGFIKELSVNKNVDTE